MISANNFTPVTWASGIDPKTGRPIENPAARYDKTGKRVDLLPGALGAHSWQAMAFNPATGLFTSWRKRFQCPTHRSKTMRRRRSAGTFDRYRESTQRQGLPHRVGSCAPEGSVARQLSRALERRHPHVGR